MNPDKMEEKLEKILRVVTRTEVQVEQLVSKDMHTRITRLETRNKVLQWVGGIAISAMGLAITVLRYFDSLQP